MTEPKVYRVVDAVAAAIIVDNRARAGFESEALVSDIFAEDIALPIDQAYELINNIVQNHTIRILRGDRISDFDKGLVAAIQNPDAISTHSWKLISYAPKVWRQSQIANTIIESASTSNYIGEVGGKVELTVQVLRCKYVTGPGYSFYSVIAIDTAGNLITFAHKCNIAQIEINIKGKVKEHKIDPYCYNGQVTQLNYVKIITNN